MDDREVINKVFRDASDGIFNLFNNKDISDKSKYWMLKRLANSCQAYYEILNAFEEFEKEN